MLKVNKNTKEKNINIFCSVLSVKFGKVFSHCIQYRRKPSLCIKTLTRRGSLPEVFLGKGILKICSKFTGKHPCRIVISIKLQSKFIEIVLRHGCSPVNFWHIFRTHFLKNTSEGLLFNSVKTMNFKIL